MSETKVLDVVKKTYKNNYVVKEEEEEVEMGISPELGRPEHHEFQWIDFDHAYDISSPRVRLVVQWARQVIGT